MAKFAIFNLIDLIIFYFSLLCFIKLEIKIGKNNYFKII